MTTLALQPSALKPHPSPRPAALRTVPARDHAQTLALRGHGECPECTKLFMASAIVREEQEPLTEPLAGYAGPCVLFKMFCDHCDHLVTQLHALDEGRVGEPIGSYGFIKDQRRVDAFLRIHPEARGVEQS